MTKFANYLQVLLTKYRLSQRELARRSGVNYVTINRRFKGQIGNMENGTIDRLAKGFACTPAERIAMYRLAGVMPPEIVDAFCASIDASRDIYDYIERRWKADKPKKGKRAEFRKAI